MSSKKSNGIIIVDSDSTDQFQLSNDDTNVRINEVSVVTNPLHMSGGKSFQISEARVVCPRDDEEMQRLQSQFANLNPKSPFSSPNLVAESETGQYRIQHQSPPSPPNLVTGSETGQYKIELDGRPRLGNARGVSVDPRLNPRTMQRVTMSACHPTDELSPPTDDNHPMFPQAGGPPSQVQVVPPQPPTPKISVHQLIQMAARSEQLSQRKKEMIEKLVRNFNIAKRTTPVSPDVDMEKAFEQKEKQINLKAVPEEQKFNLKVVPEAPPEDMTITISDDDPAPYVDIRKEPTKPEPRILSCQPSDTIGGSFAIETEQLNESSYLRQRTFLKGYVLPGTAESLTNLLQVYSMHSAELAIGCHGILTTQNNRSTDLGEYEEEEGLEKGHTFLRNCGKGSYGMVKMCRDNFTKIDFVKKEIHKADRAFLYEVKTLSELKHLNITELYGFILRDGVPEILMEYAGVSMLEYTLKPSSPDDTKEDKIIDITYQGLSGLEYLTNKGIIHYDIKPENLCILKKENRRIVKITDFGSAKKVTEPPDFMGCTVEYMSPELGIQLVQSKFPTGMTGFLLSYDVAEFFMTTKSDIFSFALAVIFMYRKGHAIISLFNNGRMDYNGLDETLVNRLRQTILISLVKNPAIVKMLIPDNCSSEMRNVLKCMVEEFPGKRPTASQLKDIMDDVLNRKTIPDSVQFVTQQSFVADKHRSMNRQLSSRNTRRQELVYRGAVRNNASYNRRRSSEQSSLPYGWSQKMDVADTEVVEQLQGIVPNFDQFK